MVPAPGQLGQVERVRRNLNGLSDDDKASLIRRSRMSVISGVKGYSSRVVRSAAPSFCEMLRFISFCSGAATPAGEGHANVVETPSI